MQARIPDWLWLLRHEKDKIALIDEHGAYSYAEFAAMVSHLAAYLQEIGVGRSAKIALLARDTLVFAAMTHAIRFIEGILIPINTRLTDSEVAWQCQDVGIDAFFVDEGHESRMMKLLASHEVTSMRHGVIVRQKLTSLSMTALKDAVFSPKGIDRQAIATIIYTSGTTGKPKGAMITYDHHLNAAMMSAFRLGLDEHEVWLTAMPLFHVGGQGVLMRSVIYGTTAYLLERFDEQVFNCLLNDGKATLVSVVPAMLSRMFQEQGHGYHERLRCVLLGGGPVSMPLLAQAKERGVPVSQTYGMTETNAQFTTLSPRDSMRKFGSAGKPLSQNELCILDEKGQVLPQNTPGEIVVRGPTVIDGYYQNEEATRESFFDGWFHTGDLGYVDEEGYLYVLDRKHDLIVSGGENVYPAEVESVLLAFEGVKEVGVVAKADARYDQVPIAFVVLKETAQAITQSTLLYFCQQRLASYKVPKEIRFVEVLPRNASSKLLRRELLTWV
jgi:O-succinylbenzoic acid--CoA ligase